ncbi:hypothetical protein [Reinekea blandensis]|uniref:Gp5/Type VI secretion system Vgr protein OB-fold domain-containing protein n=1 Tax=Reinekea blandensis MED297 TaxID=314283 RepID=A4BCY5_9GAMM|nr:hypothetical protein [Reinekea blandensis]EAR10067.1 hypothetical protein MED297_08261 [Reinekea sp. MED297] [Reinekea blandensis MED297]
MAAQPLSTAFPLNQPVLAEVATVDNNFVTHVLWQGSEYAIEACMQSVHQFSIGDPVMVQPLNGRLAVIQHFQQRNEPQPTLRQIDGRWVLNCPNHLKLQVGKQTLSLSSDGDITLEGEDITSQASGNNRLLGGRVELN